RIHGNNNIIRPDMQDYVKEVPNGFGIAPNGNRFSNRDGKVDPLCDAAAIKQAYVAALDQGIAMPDQSVIPREVAQRGLDNQWAQNVAAIQKALQEEYARTNHLDWAAHAARAQVLYAQVVRSLYDAASR